MDELVNQGLIVFEKVFDNLAGDDVIEKTMNVCDDLCESERFGRMWEELVTGQGDVTQITEKFIRLTEFHEKRNCNEIWIFSILLFLNQIETYNCWITDPFTTKFQNKTKTKFRFILFTWSF